MKGITVKKCIKISGKTIEDVAISINVSREHLTRLLKDDLDLDETYIQLIKNSGIELIDDVIKGDEKNLPDMETIKRFLTLNEKLVDMIYEKDAIFEKIINKGLDSGAIAWNAEKTELIEKKRK